MSSRIPQIGDISTDGLYRWDGREWQPLARGHRLPTSWTRPMQLVSAGYLVLAAFQTLLSTVLFVNPDAMARVLKAQTPNIPEDQLASVVGFSITFTWGSVILISLAWLFLALGSFLGWRWMFWVVLAALAFSSIGVASNLLNLLNPPGQVMPPGALVVSWLFSLGALALAVWFVVAAVRFGPWAMRKPGAA